MKKTVTYVLVADGARARLYANHGVGKGLQPVSGATHKADLHHHDRDILADKPGRASSSAGNGRVRLGAAHRLAPLREAQIRARDGQGPGRRLPPTRRSTG